MQGLLQGAGHGSLSLGNGAAPENILHRTLGEAALAFKGEQRSVLLSKRGLYVLFVPGTFHE
ncbi:MAG TPA: hypothetical protein VG960_08670 [Caulobacteraceae bacterium]|nr:hypothetical protein [Caulobacteraceae bacterium]